jgi:hypothetical protein
MLLGPCIDPSLYKNNSHLLTFVEGVRRRGEYYTLSGNVYGIYLANVGRQENIVFCW